MTETGGFIVEMISIRKPPIMMQRMRSEPIAFVDCVKVRDVLVGGGAQTSVLSGPTHIA